VVGSLFGAYSGVPVSESYNNVLPSANFRYQFDPELVGRLAASQTMTRADYSAISGSTNLLPPGAYNASGTSTCTPPPNQPPVNCGSGTAPNAYLKPIVSNNFDAGLEWYFAQRSLLAANLFYMDLKNYIGYGTTVASYKTTGTGLPPAGAIIPFLLDIPINTTGRAQGVEVMYQQAFGNFGVDLNYTYTDAKQTSGIQPNADQSPGTDRLVGASKNVYNISGYYENAHFSARVSWNYRSAFYSGLDRSTAFTQDSTGTLAASLAYIINENFSINLDGQNLNNPTLKYYALNTDQPRAFYTNGRQYYLTLRAKF
jgi:iron complex outermembrane receptor protein